MARLFQPSPNRAGGPRCRRGWACHRGGRADAARGPAHGQRAGDGHAYPTTSWPAYRIGPRPGTSAPACASANTTVRSPTATGCWRWSPGTSVRLQASASSRRAATMSTSRHAQAIVNCSVGDSAARLEFALINQSRRSIAVLDFMMWVTVLGCLISGGLLAWALARTINVLPPVSPLTAHC